MARPPARRRPAPRVAGHRRLLPGTRPSSPSVLDPETETETQTQTQTQTGAAPGGLEPLTEPAPIDAPAPPAGHDVPEPAPVSPARSPRSRLPEAALGVVAVLLAVLAVLEALSWRESKATAQAEVDASVAARAAVVALISVNYEALPEGRARAAKLLAPKFRPEYEKFLTSLETTAKANKLVSSASVEASGVVSASPGRVTVLLFIDQISTNASRSAPRIDQPRVRMKMIKSGGKWLVEAFEVV